MPMAPDADPYRTLGLSRGASLAEVRKAYRRLAKVNHPDAAGEAALPRFLAIQAAYDQIVGPGSANAMGRPKASTRRPWDADPARADATRRAYGGRARRAPTGEPRRPGSASGGQGPNGGRPGSPPGGVSRDPNKATPGSTTYDGADVEPFEPDWGGASWYGTTTGTYWTLNPKEYADPRKHGPEYQARARRAAAAAQGTPAGSSAAGPGDTVGSDGLDVDDATAASAASSPRPANPPPTHTTGSWWEATAGTPASEQPAPDPAPDSARAAGGEAASGAPASDSGGWDWLEGREPRLAGRVGRAVLGWVPIGLAIGWLGGEVSGCGRFSAACDDTTGSVVWLALVGALALLLVLPRVATIAGTAALAALAVAIPVALISAAPGVDGITIGGLPVLGLVSVAAWVAGLAWGLLRSDRGAARPVS